MHFLFVSVSCMQYPVVMDVVPDKNNPDGPVKNCCKGGYLGAVAQEPGKSLASFKVGYQEVNDMATWTRCHPGSLDFTVDRPDQCLHSKDSCKSFYE